MKLNKLFALMKQRKRIVVAQGKTAQWVGDGYSLYPIYNLPKLTERTMQTLLDVSDDAWDKFTFEEHQVLYVSEEDFDEGQTDLTPLKITIHWKGGDFIPLVGDGRIYYIPLKYLNPFADDGLLSYSFRNKARAGNGVIAVNEGLLLSGIIVPEVIDDPLYTETLYRIYDLTKRQA